MEQHPLFSSRDTLDEAVVYGVDLLNSLPHEHRRTAFTAFHTLSNTAIKLQEPAMQNLTPDWHSPTKQLSDDLTMSQAELFQQLRTRVAPFTDSIILALDRASDRGMSDAALFSHPEVKILNRVCKLLARLSGLDKQAHEKEFKDFHDQMEQTMPKTPEELLAFLAKMRNSRG